jgi:hypothetical protein
MPLEKITENCQKLQYVYDNLAFFWALPAARRFVHPATINLRAGLSAVRGTLLQSLTRPQTNL